MTKDDVVIDKPVENKKDDKFHYSEIYEPELSSLIENESNLKIGLFGSYGVGKSTIVELVKENFGKRKNESFIHFSVWGFSSLEIVRKLLFEISKECLNKEFNELYEEKIELNISRKTWLKIFTGMAFLLLLAVFLVISLPTEMLEKVKVLGFLFTALLIFILGLLIVKISKKPPLEMDEFQSKLKELLEEIEEKEIKKIVIAVDDLDRCEVRTINEVLEKLNVLVSQKKDILIKLILPFSINKYASDDKFPKFYDNTKKLLDVIIWVSNPSKLNLYRLAKKERVSGIHPEIDGIEENNNSQQRTLEIDDKKLEKEILPEFSIIFSNPRDLEIFRNFVITHAKIKNNCFKVFSKNNDLEDEFKITAKITNNSHSIEGSFAFICYVIYLFPEKAEEFFLEPGKILDYTHPTNLIGESGQDPKSFFMTKEKKDDQDPREKEEKDKNQKIRNASDKFKKYNPKNTEFLYLMLENDLSSFADISKTKGMFDDLDIQKVYEEFKKDSTYFFLVLKEIIMDRARNRQDLDNYHRLFLDKIPKEEDDKRLGEYRLKLLEFLLQMMQYEEFLDSLEQFINSRIQTKEDFIKKSPKIFETIKYSPEERDHIIKILTFVLSKVVRNINMEKPYGLSRFIYVLNIRMGSILRLFDIHQIRSKGPKISSFVNTGIVDEQNLVDYSYKFLETKYIIESKNEKNKENIRKLSAVTLDEGKIKEIIDGLFGETARDESEFIRRVKLESIEACFFMLLSKTKKRTDQDKIFSEFKQRLDDLKSTSRLKEEFIYEPFLLKHKEQILELFDYK